MNAISFLLLGSGLAMCGWRFVSAFQSKRDDAAKNDIGKLVSSLFFLSAAYNGILGIGSLFFSQSPNGLFIIQLLAHLALTGLAFMSVYALYYIFWPTVSPHLPLTTVGLIGSSGFLLLLASSSQPLTSAITFCLLTVSLLATLYIFIQLFQRTEARSIKILSLAFSVLTLASVGHALIQLFISVSLPQQISSLPLSALEITLGLIGAGVLIWSISTPALRVAAAIFIVLMGWWTVLYIASGKDIPQAAAEPWISLYNLIALWGVWFGFKAAQRWGGFKTVFGKAISFFTLGLLLQILGQISFGIYVNFLNIQVPYPSFADIPYLGSVIIYLIAIVQLGKAFGVDYKLKILRGKILGLILFMVFFGLFSLTLGLDYTFDWQHPMIIILDFAYPLVEALYIAAGILIYVTIINNVSIQKKITLLIIGALGMQYAADALFSYKVTQDTLTGGTASELLYLTAYFLMTIAIIRLGASPVATHAFILEHPDTNPLPGQSKSRLATGMITNAYAEMLNLLETIRANIKNQKTLVLKKEHQTISTHTAP